MSEERTELGVSEVFENNGMIEVECWHPGTDEKLVVKFPYCQLPRPDGDTEINETLLNALKEIVSQIDQGGASGKVFARDSCISFARDAIAKAKSSELWQSYEDRDADDAKTAYQQLLDAADAVFVNAVDCGAALVDEDNDDDDYPTDEDGDKWYQDWWDLKLALERCNDEPEVPVLSPETLQAMIDFAHETTHQVNLYRPLTMFALKYSNAWKELEKLGDPSKDRVADHINAMGPQEESKLIAWMMQQLKGVDSPVDAKRLLATNLKLSFYIEDDCMYYTTASQDPR